MLNVEKDALIIANGFNNHYIDVGEKLATSIQNDSNAQEENLNINTNHQLLAFEPVTDEEVTRVINQLKSKQTTGPDGISSITLKKISEHIVKPIRHLINLSFKMGEFPKEFKRAVVKPIFKNGDRTEISNYRPISLVNNLNKVIETCIKSRLVKYLESNNILSQKQFGFRKNRGTQDTLTDLTKTVYDNLNKNNKVITVFLDLAKCFDSLSHEILIKKITEIGIGADALKLCKSYLRERTQFVKVAEAVSSEKYIKFGTPQGTLLGPILFLIFINSFCNIQLENGEITTYADDTVITFYGANLREVFDFANTGLNRLKRHLDRDLLSINYDKSKYILFGFKSIIVPPELTLQMHKTHNVEHCDCPEIKQTLNIWES